MTDRINKNYYLPSATKAKKHRVLYHYTSFESLLKIIDSGELRFTILSALNDPLEYKRLKEDRIYVACFNYHDKDTIPLWKMYADGPYGIRIGFTRKYLSFFEYHQNSTATNPSANLLNFRLGDKDIQHNSNDPHPNRAWKVFDVSLLDVIYDDNLEKYMYQRDVYQETNMPLIDFPDVKGYLKKECWKFESETRIRVALSPHKDSGVWLDERTNKFVYADPPYKYIYCKMPDLTLQNMKVMFSPISSNELIEMMQREIIHRIKDFNIENFERSDIVIRR